MNQIIIDGRVQRNTNLFGEIASFNIASITGNFTDIYGNQKKRRTLIRVVYPKNITPADEEIIQEGNMVRVYGKFDSEQNKDKKGSVVYNKIICARKVVKIEYDELEGKFVEVPFDKNGR